MRNHEWTRWLHEIVWVLCLWRILLGCRGSTPRRMRLLGSYIAWRQLEGCSSITLKEVSINSCICLLGWWVIKTSHIWERYLHLDIWGTHYVLMMMWRGMQSGTSPKVIGIRWKQGLPKAKTHTRLPVNISILKLILKIVSISVNTCVESVSKTTSKCLITST
jgi:hypothetical protein